MFNAWTLARNHHCILQQGCDNYSDGNIFYPNKDSMLYSETQLSAGLLSLPLHLINDNPLFAYNIWTIASFFFSGIFMYLLARHLSNRNQLLSVMAGLAFEFAPYKITSFAHLQNLSIFYLPLIVLFVLKFIESKKKKYLVFLLFTLILQFYASWYQMAFVIFGLGVLLFCFLIFKLARPKLIILLSLVVVLAVIATLPLAKEYMRFSKVNEAKFRISDKVAYSSSLFDYVIPHPSTIEGKIYYHLKDNAQINRYNPDSNSYHGLVLYVLAAGVLTIGYKWRKKAAPLARNFKLAVSFAAVGLVGFIVSLGPLLKIKGSYSYGVLGNGAQVVVPLPYLIIDKLIPQLSFIRALGRASVLVLFILCCILALLPVYMSISKLKRSKRNLIYGIVSGLIVIEILPFRLIGLAQESYSRNIVVPPVYGYIKSHTKVDNIIILRADKDYPDASVLVAAPEDVLWAGYHNKNIFNGYSGYVPPDYNRQYADFIDFQPDDIPKMSAINLRYVLVDKLLSSSNPELVKKVSLELPNKVFEDGRYALFKIK